MTTQLEDRLRHYGTTLDHAALATMVTTETGNDVDATVIVMPLRPSQIGDRNRRRVLLSAAAASLLLITAGIWAVSSRHSNDDAVQVGSAPTGSQPLLVPPGTAPKGMWMFIPAGRYSAVVVSPSGTPYTIDLMGNHWGTMPTGTATRTVHNRPFGLMFPGDLNTAGGATSTYAAPDQCSMTFTHGPATATPWTGEALALLGAQQSDNGVITVDLPAGWTIAVPSGGHSSGYSFPIRNGVAGGQTTIVSTPSATAATIFSLYGAPAQIQRADFDGHTAWYSTYLASNNGTQTHLTWEAAGNAYDITARDATKDQLLAFARTLVPMSIADFESTNPDQQFSVTVASTTPAPAGGCQSRALDVRATNN